MKINSEQMLNDLGQPILHKKTCYKQPGVSLYAEDCLETLKRIETGSIDLMLTDPPYGITACDWDKEPFLPLMWAEWERILKPNGAWVFTASQPFTSNLITSRLAFFKYEIIWKKTRFTGNLNAEIMPLKAHENIVVMGRGKITYNPIKTKAAEHLIDKRINVRPSKVKDGGGYNGSKAFLNERKADDGTRHPTSVQEFENPNNNSLHPNEKPIKLFRWLLKTYSNENDLVFDGYSGSGTTAAACIKEKRNFIGSEMNKEYFDLSVKRLSEIIKQPELPW